MPYKFRVPEYKRLRVIIDTDAACEADDQYAIVHALLTPRFKIKGIIAEQFCSEGGENSVDKSYDEIIKVMHLMGKEGAVPVYKGARFPLKSQDDKETISEGADFIIEEAMKDESGSLYILCQGAITNVALALNKCPNCASPIVGAVDENYRCQYCDSMIMNVIRKK